jgi:hypothetical protein
MDLNEKIVNVRRATRLLASYNRRLMSILTLVNQTTESADKVALKFQMSAPFYHRPMGKQTTSPIGRWGWDYLPLSYAWFRWSTNGKAVPDGPHPVAVTLLHNVDDGYVTSDDQDEPDPSTFGPAEDHRTMIYVTIVAVTSGSSTDSWPSIGQVIVDRFAGHEQLDGVVKDVPTSSLPGTAAGAVVRYVGWEIPVESVASEQDVETLILEPLRKYLIAIFQ